MSDVTLIGKDSKRLQVIVSKSDAEAIEKLAQTEGRSVSNWMYHLVRKEIKNAKKT